MLPSWLVSGGSSVMISGMDQCRGWARPHPASAPPNLSLCLSQRLGVPVFDDRHPCMLAETVPVAVLGGVNGKDLETSSPDGLIKAMRESRVVGWDDPIGDFPRRLRGAWPLPGRRKKKRGPVRAMATNLRALRLRIDGWCSCCAVHG